MADVTGGVVQFFYAVYALSVSYKTVSFGQPWFSYTMLCSLKWMEHWNVYQGIWSKYVTISKLTVFFQWHNATLTV